MKTTNRKKIHRKLVRLLKKINKNIANDNLWRGRFRVYEIDESFYEYEDGSGAEIVFYAVVCDLKTGRCRLIHEDMVAEWSTSSHLWLEMNDFICNISGVIEEAVADKELGVNYVDAEFAPPSLRDFRNSLGAYSRAELYIEPAK